MEFLREHCPSDSMFQTSGLQNCERINFCCFNHLVCNLSLSLSFFISIYICVRICVCVCILSMYIFGDVNEKLINSQSKREVENFIQANLRIITRVTVFQKSLRTVPLVRS